MFNIDLSFQGVIRKWFEILKLEFVVIGIHEGDSIKPEDILSREFKEEDVLLTSLAKIDKKGNIEPVNNISIIFDKEYEKGVEAQDFNTYILDTNGYSHLLFTIKTTTPSGEEFYSYKQVVEIFENKIINITPNKLIKDFGK